MNNSQRAVLYFIFIQVGFIFAQFLSSFNGYLQFVSFYLVLPLLLTELHYRYLISGNLNATKAVKTTLRLFLLWGMVGSAVFATISIYVLSPEVNSFILQSGLGLIVIKQMFIVAVSLGASLIMYTRIANIIALRTRASQKIMAV